MIFNYVAGLAIAPLIATLLYFLVRKKAGKMYYDALVSSFVWGMVSIFLVVVFQYIAAYYRLDNFVNLRRITFYAFVVMGVGSELGKYLVLRYHSFTKSNFNGPADSIVYSVMIAMGFSFMSNVLYFTLPVYTSIDFTYAITVIFANLFFAVVLGFFVGLAKIRENRFIDSMTGLFAASFFHALYNFCFISEDYKLLMYLSIGMFLIVVLLLYKALDMNLDMNREKKGI